MATSYNNSIMVGNRMATLNTDEAKALQQYLNTMGAQLDEDGKIGPETRDAMQQFLENGELAQLDFIQPALQRKVTTPSGVQKMNTKTNNTVPEDAMQAIVRGAVQKRFLTKTDYEIIKRLASGQAPVNQAQKDYINNQLYSKLQSLNVTGKALSWGEWEQYLAQNAEGLEQNFRNQDYLWQQKRDQEAARKDRVSRNSARFAGAVNGAGPEDSPVETVGSGYGVGGRTILPPEVSYFSPDGLHHGYAPIIGNLQFNNRQWDPKQQVVLENAHQQFIDWYKKQPEGTIQFYPYYKIDPRHPHPWVKIQRINPDPQEGVVRMVNNGTGDALPSGTYRIGTPGLQSTGSVSNPMPTNVKVAPGQVIISKPQVVSNGVQSTYNQGTAAAFKQGGRMNYVQYIQAFSKN